MMKKKPAKKFINVFLAACVVVALAGCKSRAEKYYDEAYDKINQNQFLDAVSLLESSIELEKNHNKKMRAMFEMARLLRFEIQDYPKALAQLKKIVLSAEDPKLRLLSQEAISEIYFDNLQDYEAALKELLVVEPLTSEPEKKEKIKLKIAQAYRLTGNSDASLEYIDAALKQGTKQKISFLKLKSQILQSQQKHDRAAEVLNEIYKTDPNLFEKDNMYLEMALIYEEKQDYKKAIEYLEQNKEKITDKNYLELRIKRLKEKQINKPFNKGMRK